MINIFLLHLTRERSRSVRVFSFNVEECNPTRSRTHSSCSISLFFSRPARAFTFMVEERYRSASAFQSRGRFLVRPLPAVFPFLDLEKAAGHKWWLLVYTYRHCDIPYTMTMSTIVILSAANVASACDNYRETRFVSLKKRKEKKNL